MRLLSSSSFRFNFQELGELKYNFFFQKKFFFRVPGTEEQFWNLNDLGEQESPFISCLLVSTGMPRFYSPALTLWIFVIFYLSISILFVYLFYCNVSQEPFFSPDSSNLTCLFKMQIVRTFDQNCWELVQICMYF